MEKLKRAIYDISDDGWVRVRCPHCEIWDKFWSAPLFPHNEDKLPVIQKCDCGHAEGGCGKEFIIDALTQEEELKRAKGELKGMKGLEDEKWKAQDEVRNLKTEIDKLKATPWNRALRKIKNIVNEIKKGRKNFQEKAWRKTLNIRDKILFRKFNKFLVERIDKSCGMGPGGETPRPREQVTFKVMPSRMGKLFGYRPYRVQYQKTSQWQREWVQVCSMGNVPPLNFKRYLDTVYERGY